MEMDVAHETVGKPPEAVEKTALISRPKKMYPKSLQFHDGFFILEQQFYQPLIAVMHSLPASAISDMLVIRLLGQPRFRRLIHNIIRPDRASQLSLNNLWIGSNSRDSQGSTTTTFFLYF